MIRTGDWRQYFTGTAALNTAAPISYTFRNLGDGSIANVAESTSYTIKTCAETSTLPAQFTFAPEQSSVHRSPHRSRAGWSTSTAMAGATWCGITATPAATRSRWRWARPMAPSGPSAASHPDTPAEGWATQPGDRGFHGDGKTDLAWSYLGSVNKSYVTLSTGGGWTFGAVQQRSEGGWSAYHALSGDTDGDGDDDLIYNTVASGNVPREPVQRRWHTRHKPSLPGPLAGRMDQLHGLCR